MSQPLKFFVIAFAITCVPAPMAYSQTLAEAWTRCRAADNELAIGGCTRVIQLGRDTDANLARAFRFRAMAYLESDIDQALRDFDEAVLLVPGDAESLAQRGRVHAVKKGAFELAIQDYDRAIALNPKQPLYLSLRGDAYYLKGEYSRAIQDFDASLKLDPRASHALFGRGLARRRLGDTSAGDRDIAAAIEILPDAELRSAERGMK